MSFWMPFWENRLSSHLLIENEKIQNMGDLSSPAIAQFLEKLVGDVYQASLD